MVVRGGHLLIVRGRSVVWRSCRMAYPLEDVGSAAFGPSGVAFSISKGESSVLYVAAPHAPERVVGHNEEPVGWLSSGRLVTSRWRSDGSHPDLLVRGPDGTRPVVVTPGVGSFGPWSPWTGAVLFVTKAGRLERLDGSGQTAIADVRALGFHLRPEAMIPTLGRLGDGRIVVVAPNRIAVLTSAGRVEASASFTLPRGEWGWVGAPPDGLGVEPNSGTVVFVVTRWDYTPGPKGWKGWEGVYALPEGAARGTLLYGGRMYMAPCAHMARMSWRGAWLLYSACEGRVVAIDTTGGARPIDLTRIGRRLPAPPDDRRFRLQDAAWAA